jgi:hypothetical protein
VMALVGRSQSASILGGCHSPRAPALLRNRTGPSQLRSSRHLRNQDICSPPAAAGVRAGSFPARGPRVRGGIWDPIGGCGQPPHQRHSNGCCGRLGSWCPLACRRREERLGSPSYSAGAQAPRRPASDPQPRHSGHFGRSPSTPSTSGVAITPRPVLEAARSSPVPLHLRIQGRNSTLISAIGRLCIDDEVAKSPRCFPNTVGQMERRDWY